MRFFRFAVSFGAITLAALNGCGSERERSREDNVVENHPHRLVITSPKRASFLEEGADKVEVRGTGATSALTINGEPAEVAPDGSFRSTVKPKLGLNLVVAIDGESRLETPFLYGHFEPATRPVPQAISVEIGSAGINGPGPAASIMGITNAALRGRDLIGMMKGQTFSGEAVGVAWGFTVSGGHHGAVDVDFGSAPKGVSALATMRDVVVEGMLTIGSTTRFTRIIVDTATVSGETELAIDDGALTTAMPAADAKFEGFRWDSGNLGFPCCVDSIATNYLRPKIEQAIRDGMQTEIPKALTITLGGLGLPNELDLSALGLAKPIPVTAKFDGGDFDLVGAQLSASVLFGGAFDPGAPGTMAPGWLKLGRPMSTPRPPTSIAASFSVDAVNQLLFAAWGSGALTFTLPPPNALKLSAALPPLISVTNEGAVRVALGELLVQQADAPSPFAAVSVLQDVVPGAEQQALVLTPKGEPTISITWLADGNEGSGRNLVAGAAKDQLTRLLKPFRLPLPRVALDPLGPGFTGQSLGVQTLTIGVDARSARVAAAGAMVVGP